MATTRAIRAEVSNQLPSIRATGAWAKTIANTHRAVLERGGDASTDANAAAALEDAFGVYARDFASACVHLRGGHTRHRREVALFLPEWVIEDPEQQILLGRDVAFVDLGGCYHASRAMSPSAARQYALYRAQLDALRMASAKAWANLLEAHNAPGREVLSDITQVAFYLEHPTKLYLVSPAAHR